jgi:hypothetical protein
MPSFEASMLAARDAKSAEEFDAVLKDVLDRLATANSAIAVDSARSILSMLQGRGFHA